MTEVARVHAGGIGWHVERAGAGPVALLLHGTGASAHSWAPLVPLLAGRFSVVVPDLPGHGRTDPPPPSCRGLPGMAWLLGSLLRALDLRPALLVGHSAGAAIAIRMVFDRSARPAALVGVNAALRPLAGMSAGFFPLAARALAAGGLGAGFFARRAREPGTVDRLLARTGSRLPDDARRSYEALLAQPGHVAAALDMMAHWDLAALDLARLRLPVTLLAADRDGMVPPADSRWAAGRIAGARVAELPGLGHLAHEEDPRAVAALILAAWNDATVAPGAAA